MPDTCDARCINTIRFLAADAVEQANSGHPGLPLGAAPMAHVLWTRHLRHDPRTPSWPDRDRFVLSAGHGSMLLYALLHLSGYDLPLDELRCFRQWGSRTPGHPEYGLAPGVETTTGPLGQGISTAVGMAMAEAHLAATFNRPGHSIVDHMTYVLASDGDFMEGVCSEACALAGHLNLGKLIVLYDDNRITLSGSTALTFTEDLARRLKGCGWHCREVTDGNDLDAVDEALTNARLERSRPSLIAVRTVIGYGAPGKQGTFGVHGSPLGEEELAAAKDNLGWPREPRFLIPDDVSEHFAALCIEGGSRRQRWQKKLRAYEEAWPAEAAELSRRLRAELPADWDRALPKFTDMSASPATRKTSEAVLQRLPLPELMGGSADLNPSTFAWIKAAGDFQSPQTSPAAQGAVGGPWGYTGRNIHYGVREHAMGAISSGLALHGGIIPFAGTFLTFADYMRPAIRLAALSGLRVIYIFTHDSIGLGEDGPTHQPVEHLLSLRAIPGLTVIRPADAAETVQAWGAALRRVDGPTALILSRQGLPLLDRTICAPADSLSRGGYILWQSVPDHPELILLGTGAEVHVALAAGRELAAEGCRVRVVSLPSWELFDAQDREWHQKVLPDEVRARVAVEAGRRLGWEHYTGLDGIIVGLDRFGASAPADTLFEEFGITAHSVIAQARTLLKGL